MRSITAVGGPTTRSGVPPSRPSRALGQRLDGLHVEPGRREETHELARREADDLARIGPGRVEARQEKRRGDARAIRVEERLGAGLRVGG